MQVNLPDGSTVKVDDLPDFATEVTQKRMLDLLKKMTKGDENTVKNLETLVTTAKDAAKDDKKAADEQKKAFKELSRDIGSGMKGFQTRFADRIEADTQQVFGFATMALGKLATAAVGAAGFILGMAKASAGYAEDVGRQMDAVVSSGASFGDRFGGSMGGVISSLNGMGITTQQAAGLMAEFSRATQIVTKARLPDLVSRFRGLSKAAGDFNLPLGELTRQMMDEVQQKSQVYDITKLSSEQLAASTYKSVRLQNLYAGALGVSVEQLRKSVAGQVKSNDYIMAATLQYPKLAQEMLDFGTVMEGTAGESFKPIGDAIMSMIAAPEAAASEQGQAISMFGAQLQASGVDLNGFVKKHQQMVQATGNINGEAVGEELTALLRQAANNPEATARMIKAAKAVGINTEMVSSFSQSLVNVRSSADRVAKELKPDPFKQQVDDMRDTMNALNAVLDDAKKNLFGASYKDMQAILEGMTALIEPVASAFIEIVRALTGTGAGESLKGAIESLGGPIKEFGHEIAERIKFIRETFESFKKDGKIDWAGFIGQLLTDAIWGAFNLAGDIIAAAAGAIWENPKILLAILAGVGTLFAIAAAKAAAGAVVKGVGQSIADKVLGRSPAPAAGGAPGPAAPARGGNVGTMGKSIASVGKGIGDFAKSVGKGAGALLSEVGKGLGNLGTGLGKFAGAVGSGIGKAIAGVMQGLAQGSIALGTAVASGVGALGLAAFAGIILAIGKALEWAAPFMKEAAPVLMKLIEVVGQVALGGLAELGETIRGIADVIGNVLIAAIREVPNIIRAVGDGFKSVFDGISGTITAVGEQIQGIITSVGNGINSVLDGVSSVITSVGEQIQGIISSVAAGISEVIKTIRGAEDEANLIKAQTDSVKELSSIQPGNIVAVADAIQKLASALSNFGDSTGGTWNELVKGALGGGRVNFIQAQIDLFNQFGTLNTQAMYAGASAIVTLTDSLMKFANIDVNKMAAVNESIYAMTRANDATIKSMERVAKLDGKVIAENARAIMIYNGAAQGEVIVPPTPAAGADLSSFYQAIVKALNGGTPVSQASLNSNRAGGSQPETLQQQMVRLLSTIASEDAAQNRKLDELIKRTK